MDKDFILSKYVDILRRFINQECIQLDEPMLDSGINSFDVIEIMAALEETFNIEFTDNLINPELFISPQTLYNGLITILSKRNEI